MYRDERRCAHRDTNARKAVRTDAARKNWHSDDALAQSKSANLLMGDTKPQAIAFTRDLVASVRASVAAELSARNVA